MRLATLDLSAEMFVEFSKAFKFEGLGRHFRVRDNALPDDAEVVRITFHPYSPSILRLVLKSKSFTDVPEGADPPELPGIICETIYDGELVEV